MTKTGVAALFVFGFLAFSAQPALAIGNQGETPVGGGQQAEEPIEDIQLTDAIRADVVRVTRMYIQEQSKDGRIQVQDPVSNTTLQLRFRDVPESSVQMVAPNLYVSEGDFETADGDNYKLNFWVEGKDRSSMKVTKASIYEADGKKRYEWEKQGNFVRQRATGDSGGTGGGGQSGY